MQSSGRTPSRASRSGMRRSLPRVGAALAAFGIAAGYARSSGIGDSEAAVFRAVNELPSSLERPVWVFMQAGSFPAVVVAAVAARASGRSSTAIRIGVSGTTAWVACKVVKRIVRRGRPESELDSVEIRGHEQSGLGFPSGHAAVAFSIAAAAAGDAGRLGPLVWPLAVFVGLARMYVGAHLPADVAGGVTLGYAIGEASRIVVPGER